MPCISKLGAYNTLVAHLADIECVYNKLRLYFHGNFQKLLRDARYRIGQANGRI